MSHSMRRRRHFKAQEMFVGSIPLNDGGAVTGPNWYWRKQCVASLRRRYTRIGLYPPPAALTRTTAEGEKK